MTKIMIIDDEPLVRETLRRTIEWQKYDCEIVAEAADGREAMEIYKRTLPDIIITDIVMTYSNGLDFISEVRAVNPDVEIIILSGYDNFEYAKDALKYGVSAYLLKPVSNDEIISEILKSKKKIENIKQVKKAMQKQTDIQKENFLVELLSLEDADNTQFNSLCERYQISLPSDKYSVAIFQVDNISADKINTTFIKLMDIINYHISTSMDYVLSSFFNNNLVVLYVYSPLSAGDVYEFLRQIQISYNNSVGHTVTIGTSGLFKNLAIIGRAYHQAMTALKQKVLFGMNSIIKYTDIALYPEQSVIELTFDDINEIINYIKHREIDKVIQIIDAYFDKISPLKRVNIDSIKNNILNLITTLIREVIKNSNTLSLIFNRAFFPAVELQQLEFLSEIHSWIIDIIKSIGKYYDLYMPYNYSPTLTKAMLYIQENYAANIKPDDVAKKLLISSRTLSRLFLSETGKSFSKNLAEYRIKMAIHLIENTQYRIVDIAALVGYNSLNNFYNTFKKITGHHPMYYKRNGDKEEI